nr:MAG TPA: hypothetical protein [Caudoviricetes sp.]
MGELEIIKEFLSICSGITVIGAACSVIYKAYKSAKQPQKDIESRVVPLRQTSKTSKRSLITITPLSTRTGKTHSF